MAAVQQHDQAFCAFADLGDLALEQLGSDRTAGKVVQVSIVGQ
jgi:hypothetical protein